METTAEKWGRSGEAQLTCVLGGGCCRTQESQENRAQGAWVHVCKGWEKKILGACIPVSAGQLGKEGVRYMSVQECWERGYWVHVCVSTGRKTGQRGIYPNDLLSALQASPLTLLDGSQQGRSQMVIT